jgi:hypothetical protein
MASSIKIPAADSNAATSTLHHASPPLGLVAIIFAILFSAGLCFVVSFRTGEPNFPGQWESADTIVTYFQTHSWAVLMCAFFHFGAAIALGDALGEFGVSTMSRLRFFGVNASGAYIALFGGLMAAFNMAVSSTVLWVMSSQAAVQNSVVLPALYYLQFALGGVGFSIPIAVFMAGVCIPAAFMKLLPKWIVIFGLILTGIGTLSWFSWVFPKLCFLVPLTIFPSFAWMIAAGLTLPKSIDRSN